MPPLEKHAVPGGTRAAISGLPFDSAAYAAFRAVFDSSNEALVIISDGGAIQTANPRARELLHLKEHSPATKGLDDFLSGCISEQLHSLSRNGQTFVAFPHDADASKADRSPIRVTLRSILPVSHHLLLSLENTPNFEASEPHIRHVEAELRAVLDSIPVGILVFDKDGRIRWSNPRFAELLDVQPLELEAIKTVDELSSVIADRFRNCQAFSARWRAFFAGHRGPAHDDLEWLSPGSRSLARYSRTITDHGRAVGWLEIYSEGSERQQIQQHSLQTEKMAALGKVVAGIAHELNNPLTTILGNIQLLLGRSLQPSAVAEARRIYQEAERARRVVKNLLYIAREHKPDDAVVDLNEIIKRTLAVRSYELKTKNINIQTELAADLPRTMADPYQLQQVMLNLLTNAEQALFEGRGRGLVRIRTWHTTKKGEQRILFELSDDGPGISPQIAPKIFDPFFTTKPPGVGTGLGLSIVYGIVRHHNGEINCESQPGAGAKFTVDLPVVPPPSGLSTKGKVPAQPGIKQARILVVEDEPTVAQLVVDVLQEDGHIVDAVTDSHKGLELLSQQNYDLIVCDMRMPRLDGGAFFEALTQSHDVIRRHMLFITGDTLSLSTLQFLKSNRLPYLAKPFLVEELKLAVRQQLYANGKAARPKRRGGGQSKKRTARPSPAKRK